MTIWEDHNKLGTWQQGIIKMYKDKYFIVKGEIETLSPENTVLMQFVEKIKEWSEANAKGNND